MTKRKSVVVVGAGIVGATTALALAERGFRVDVIDKCSRVAAGTSAANGAQLSYTYTDALASPAMLAAMPKLLLGLEPAFRFHPRFDFAAARWYLRFLHNCVQTRSDQNTLAVLQKGLRAAEIMTDWRAAYNFAFDFRQAGKMVLFEHAHALEAARRRVEMKNSYGAELQVLQAADVLALEPALARFKPQLAGAVYTPRDAVGDCARFATAAVEKAIALGGGQMLFDTRVSGLVKEAGRVTAVTFAGGQLAADAVVLAGGHETVQLMRGARAPVNLMPSGGYSLTFSPGTAVPRISVTDSAAKIVVCRLGDKVRVAGMADLGAVRSLPSPRRVAVLKRALETRFPDLANYEEEGQPWTGTRPMTPDGRYFAGRSGAENLYVNTGHGMLGWTLSAASAEDVATAIAGQFAA